MSELKPCPFCGGEARYSMGVHIGGEYEAGTAKCTVCGAEVPTVKYAYDVAEPYREWNRRAERTCHKVPRRMKYEARMLACSECGYGLGDNRLAYCPKCGAKVVRDGD